MKIINITKILGFVLMAILFNNCSENYLPKPYGYFRIDLPSHQYNHIDSIGPYSTEISEYCHPSHTDDSWATNADNWVNLEYPKLNATLHLSYKKIDISNFQTVSEESRTLAYKHTVRADAIAESYFANDTTRTYGILYEMKGNAASPVQFFITDSTKNFLRGALYFNNLPNADSIAPVSIYVEQDIIHLIEKLKWKN